MSTRIQLRRDTAATWTSVNPTLANGEEGLETDTGLRKIGDGSTAWSGLTYMAGGGGGVSSVAGRTGAVVLGQADITGLFAALAAKQGAITSVATVTTAGMLAVNTLTAADATTAPFTVTLPTGQAAGTLCPVYKKDSSANAITISGNIGGVPASTATLGYQNETLLYVADASASWYRLAGHSPLSMLDARYDVLGAAAGAAASAADYSTFTVGAAVAKDVLCMQSGFLQRRKAAGTIESVFTQAAWDQVFGGSVLIGVGAPTTLPFGAWYLDTDVSSDTVSAYVGDVTGLSPIQVLDTTPPNIHGLLANRPAASTLSDSTVYYNEDVAGGAAQVRSGAWATLSFPPALPAPTYAVIAADTTVANASTTLVDLTGLGVPIGTSATEIWLAKFWLLVNGSAAGDLKLGWATMPTSATVQWGPQAVASTFGGFGTVAAGTQPQPILTAASTVIPGLNGGTSGVSVVALIFGGGTAGTVQLQGAQGTSDATNLVLKKGSLVEYVKVKA